MISSPAHSASLEALESSINSILLHTASVFINPAKPSSRDLSQINVRLRRAVPGAIANFHDALDDLEAELICARAVMRRDLAEFRSNAMKVHADQAVAVTNEAKSRGQSVEAQDKDGVEIHDRKDASPEDTSNTEGMDAPKDGDLHTDEAQQGLHLDDSAAISGESKDIEMSAAPATDRDDVGGSAVNSQGDSSAESTIAKQDDSGNGNLEGSPQVQDNQTDPQAKDGNDEGTEAFSNMDVSSLLPGLEMYANDPSSANFNDIDSYAGLDPSNDGGDMNADHMMNDAGQDGGNSFDDLFDLGEFGGESGESGEFATNPAGFDTQFDENFFNLD